MPRRLSDRDEETGEVPGAPASTLNKNVSEVPGARASAARARLRPPVPAEAELRDLHADADTIIKESLPADAGMNTAEYAVGTLAAVAFAGILLKVLTSDGVQAALAGVIQRALG